MSPNKICYLGSGSNVHHAKRSRAGSFEHPPGHTSEYRWQEWDAATQLCGGCAQSAGQLFAALVVFMSRNPSMKEEDLLTCTLSGIGFFELFAVVVILIAGLLLYSE